MSFCKWYFVMAFFFGRLIEILSDLLLQVFAANWHSVQSDIISNLSRANIQRPSKSIVRLIGTHIPLPNAPKVYLNLSAWKRRTHNSATLYFFQEENSEEQIKEEISRDATSQSNSETLEAINNLKEELQELKLKIAAILENQSNSVKEVGGIVDVVTDSEEEKRCCDHLSVPPPPPPVPPTPPPPPPLPPAAVPTPKGITRAWGNTNSRRNVVNSPTTPSTIHILGQVLSEMKNGRPKLRPIQRSPGGRPLKPPRNDKTDPTDVLTEVLKRRFSVAQMSDTTNDSSDTSSQSELMFSPIGTANRA